MRHWVLHLSPSPIHILFLLSLYLHHLLLPNNPSRPIRFPAFHSLLFQTPKHFNLFVFSSPLSCFDLSHLFIFPFCHHFRAQSHRESVKWRGWGTHLASLQEVDFWKSRCANQLGRSASSCRSRRASSQKVHSYIYFRLYALGICQHACALKYTPLLVYFLRSYV